MQRSARRFVDCNAVQDLQEEQTRNRRSRRRCDFAVPDRTPASGCAEGSSQLVSNQVNRQTLLISLSGNSVRSIPYECPTFACQICVKLYLEPHRSIVSSKSTNVEGFPPTFCVPIIFLAFSIYNDSSDSGQFLERTDIRRYM